MPRLPHFPSRLIDNRSEKGVEERRQHLDNYFRGLSQWHVYPQVLLKFLKVRVPEEYIYENNLIEPNPAQQETEQYEAEPQISRINHLGLFYHGDKLFEDMNDAVVDAVIAEIYSYES